MIKYIRWFFYILIFFIPVLMNPNTSEIFEFNKILFLYTLAVIITTLWLVEKILYKQRIVQHWLIYFLGLFLLSQLAATFFSIDLQTSVFGYYGRFNGGLLSIIAYIALFYIFYDVFTVEDVSTFLKVSLLSSFVAILWGLPGKFGGDLSCLLFTGSLSNSCWTDQFRPSERMFSTLGQPNWLGAYLAIHFFIALYFFIRLLIAPTKKLKENQTAVGKYQILYGGYVILNFLTLLFTRSRSSLGAVAISLLAFIILFLFKLRKTFSRDFYIKVGVIGLSFILLLLVFKTGIDKVDRYLKTFTNIFISEQQSKPVKTSPNQDILVTDSLDIRKIVWDGAINLGLQHPLFGTGVETFAYSYYFVRPTEHNLTSEWDFIYNKAHNEYLNYLATTGFVGLIAYCLLILAVLYLYIKRIISTSTADRKLFYLSLLCGYTTILITNFFGFSTTTINLLFYILSAIPIIPDQSKNLMERRTQGRAEFASYAIIAIGLFLVWNLFRYYLADITYAKANRHLEADEYQEAMTAYSDALELKYEHVYEDRLSSTLANLGIMAYIQDEKELADKLMELSKAYNQKTLRAAPKNVLYWKTKAKNDYLFFQAEKDKDYLDDAITSLIVAEKISPTDPKIPYTIALFYVDLFQEETDEQSKAQYLAKANTYIDKSLKLKPNYPDSLALQKEIRSSKEE